MKIKKICVITGARSEYGVLRPLLRRLQYDSKLILQLVVTGMHLSSAYGLTHEEITRDGLQIASNVDLGLKGDSALAISKVIGAGVVKLSAAIENLKPDLLLLTGDRFEMFSAAIAGTILNVPIAHLGGGESTEGVIDESFRHSITKMAHLHFCATETYRQRVIQLGEHPKTVFNFGGVELDSIKELTLLNREKLEAELGYQFRERNLLVTYHPVTLERETERVQIKELLAALSKLHDTGLIFTAPNADTGNHVIVEEIVDFSNERNEAVFVQSLGQQLYFSCISFVDAVVGNSSSGLAEVPSFRKGTINIGDRQTGREKANSIIDCEPDRGSILQALEALYSREFQQKLLSTTNPYGEGGASRKIIEVIRTQHLDDILKKRFYDI